MLGLDTQEISKASTDERMLLLWTMIKEIPAKIIFLSCKKLNVDGYRWAPRSFSRQPSGEPSQISRHLEYDFLVPKAQRESRGLSVRFTGFLLLYRWRSPIGRVFYIRDEHEAWYGVMTDMRSSDRINSFDEPMNECGHVIKSSRIDPLLLPDNSPPLLMLIADSVPTNDDYSNRDGLLVFRMSREGQTDYVGSICGAGICPLSYEVHGDNINLLQKLTKGAREPFSCSDNRTNCLCVAQAL